jgi:hypothetical protein
VRLSDLDAIKDFRVFPMAALLGRLRLLCTLWPDQELDFKGMVHPRRLGFLSDFLNPFTCSVMANVPMSMKLPHIIPSLTRPGNLISQFLT